jgi:L-Ala-D/L-Glu epimerase
MTSKSVRLEVVPEVYPLKEPFRITGRTEWNAEMVTVTLRQGHLSGRGEAAGVYYRREEDIQSLVAQIEAVRREIESGITRASLQELLPAGGARNAIDCALWDLEAKQRGIPA